MYRNMVLFLLDLIFICGEPGSWSRIPPVRRWQCYHCANPTEWYCISSIHWNSYFFNNVLMRRITSLHWIRTRTPALGIQRGIHYTTDTEGYYISLNRYFLTSQRQEGTCQLHRFKPHCVHYCKHHSGHTTALLNCHHLLGVANQQICKLQTASSDLSIYAQESLIGLSYL